MWTVRPLSTPRLARSAPVPLCPTSPRLAAAPWPPRLNQDLNSSNSSKAPAPEARLGVLGSWLQKGTPHCAHCPEESHTEILPGTALQETLEQWFSDLAHCHHLQGLLNRVLGPSPRCPVPSSVHLRWALLMCISTKFRGAAGAAG